jgi:hypothetical protein
VGILFLGRLSNEPRLLLDISSQSTEDVSKFEDESRGGRAGIFLLRKMVEWSPPRDLGDNYFSQYYNQKNAGSSVYMYIYQTVFGIWLIFGVSINPLKSECSDWLTIFALLFFPQKQKKNTFFPLFSKKHKTIKQEGQNGYNHRTNHTKLNGEQRY